MSLNRARREANFFAHMFQHRRDFCAGGLMILFGLVAAVNGPNYHIGTLTRMGPGFMPTVLGVVLIILGVMIAGTATVEAAVEGEHDEHGDENLLPASPQWLAWLCIHIYFLTGFANRFLVVFHWAWSYLTFKRGARLILGKDWRIYRQRATDKEEWKG